MNSNILTILSTFFAVVYSVNEEYLTVQTSLGAVRGIKSTSRNGRTYHRFVGIQYGFVKIRFQHAEDVKPWNEVKDAFQFGSDCAQINNPNGEISLDENCLFLNIYVPEGGKFIKPVIFYMHGGGFEWGSGRTVGEKYFMDEDAVLVTVNYRLGALGFLAVKANPRASGNMGFHDQLLALKWVRNEIASFGGDPGRITLMGESAGAASVASFLVSPLTKGMFHSAIQHSGAILNDWAWRSIDDNEHVAFKLGEKLGCDMTTSDMLLDCLLKQDAAEILGTRNKLTRFYLDPIPFVPVVDTNDPFAFLPESPADIVRDGKFHKVPIIFTACQDEGLLIHGAGIIKSDEHIKALEENWVTNGGIQAYLDEDARLPKLSSAQKQQIMSSVRDHYFGQRKLEVNDEWTMRRLSEFYGDRHFLHGIRETALIMSKYTPVYAGLFTDVGADSVTRIFGYDRSLGFSHVDDLQFYFDKFGFGHFPLSPKLTKYSEKLIQIWTNFAQNGIPTYNTTRTEFTWPQVDEEQRNSKKLTWLDLGNIPNTIRNPFENRLKIWDQMYEFFGSKNLRDEL